jgi:hypothetical protein
MLLCVGSRTPSLAEEEEFGPGLGEHKIDTHK